MKEDRCDDEEAKDEDLDKETSDDDLLANLVHLKASCGLYSATSGLEAESDHIAGDEKSRHPLNRDQRQVLGLDCSDKATEYHIDRGGVKGWSNENEDGLDDEAAEGVLVVVTPYSSGVADGLDCKQIDH